jgi:hypothetical protein
MEVSNLFLTAIGAFIGQSIALAAQQNVSLFRGAQAPIGMLGASSLQFIFMALNATMKTRDFGLDDASVAILASCFNMMGTTVASFTFSIFATWAGYLIEADPFAKISYEFLMYAWIAFFFIWLFSQNMLSLFVVLPK